MGELETRFDSIETKLEKLCVHDLLALNVSVVEQAVEAANVRRESKEFECIKAGVAFGKKVALGQAGKRMWLFSDKRIINSKTARQLERKLEYAHQKLARYQTDRASKLASQKGKDAEYKALQNKAMAVFGVMSGAQLTLVAARSLLDASLNPGTRRKAVIETTGECISKSVDAILRYQGRSSIGVYMEMKCRVVEPVVDQLTSLNPTSVERPTPQEFFDHSPRFNFINATNPVSRSSEGLGSTDDSWEAVISGVEQAQKTKAATKIKYSIDSLGHILDRMHRMSPGFAVASRCKEKVTAAGRIDKFLKSTLDALYEFGAILDFSGSLPVNLCDLDEPVDGGEQGDLQFGDVLSESLDFVNLQTWRAAEELASQAIKHGRKSLAELSS